MGIARRPKESKGCQGHRGAHESEPRKKDATGASKRKLRPAGARGGGEPKRRGQLKGAKGNEPREKTPNAGGEA